MTISAADKALAAAYLESRTKTLAEEIGQSDFSEGEAGYGPDLDLAEIRMGGGGARLAYYALGEYYALTRMVTMLAARVDTEAYAIEGDRPTVYAQAETQRQRAARVCAAYGYVVDPDGIPNSQIGSINPGDDTVGDSDDATEPQTGGLARDRFLMDMYNSSGTTEWD